MCTVHIHLFPVGGDYSDVCCRQFGETLLSLRFHQFGEVVDQDFNLRHVEERRTVRLSLIFAHHSMEDHWKTL